MFFAVPYECECLQWSPSPSPLSPRSYDSESTDTLLDAHQMNDGSITPNSVSTMGSDNYFMSAKQSDAPTPTPPPSATGAAAATGNTSKERKKHDRFNGMSEEEVCKRTLPDHLDTNLDVVIVSTVDFHSPDTDTESAPPTIIPGDYDRICCNLPTLTELSSCGGVPETRTQDTTRHPYTHDGTEPDHRARESGARLDSFT